MSKSSLSSVVSNLVRASMGSSLANDVADEDLDRHVAELILKEAKQKGDRYTTDGIQAYLKNGASDSNAPKPNKRFLSSIIRNTDDHNRTILRAQAFAAQEVKKAREELERKERKARAEEAVAAERTRRLLGTARRGDSDRWSRKKDTHRSRSRKGKERAWEKLDGAAKEGDYIRRKRESESRRRRHRHRSRSDERDGGGEERRRSRRAHHEGSSTSTSTVRKRGRPRSTSRTTDDDADQYRYGSRDHHGSSHKRRRHRSRSTSFGRRSRSRSAEKRGSRRKSRSETLPDNEDDSLDSRSQPKSRQRRLSSPLIDDGDREVDGSRKLRAKHKEDEEIHDRCSQSRSPTPGPQPKCRTPQRSALKGHSHSSRSLSSMSRSPSPLPQPPPSKMDKYFEESYDPRLDVAPLSSAPKVPATGLIDNSEFEGWDAMLELIRIRRVDREEQKTLERLGLGKTKKDKDKKDKKWKGLEVETVNDRWREDSQSIMEIEYKKRGSVREWDLGKAEL